jgi:hypothetical protein
MSEDEFYLALNNGKEVYYPEEELLFYNSHGDIYIFKEKTKITLGLMNTEFKWPFDKMFIINEKG